MTTTFGGYALKNYREAGGNETIRFEAVLTHNAREFARVINDGEGGAHRYEPMHEDSRQMLADFQAFATQWNAGTKYAGYGDDDQFVDYMAELLALGRKRAVVVLIDDMDFRATGEVLQVAIPKGFDRKDVIAHLANQYQGRNLRVFDKKVGDFVAV